MKNQRKWLKQVWILKFWSLINCFSMHWTKKLTLDIMIFSWFTCPHVFTNSQITNFPKNCTFKKVYFWAGWDFSSKWFDCSKRSWKIGIWNSKFVKRSQIDPNVFLESIIQFFTKKFLELTLEKLFTNVLKVGSYIS